MKRKIAILFPVGLLLAAAVWTLAAGDQGDPLVSLSYLEGTFSQQIDEAVGQRLDQVSSGTVNGNAAENLQKIASGWTETRVKCGDCIIGETGTNILVLAGDMQMTCSGTVVDVTEGTVLASGGKLVPGHRYLVAEDSRAVFIVASKTAVLHYQGGYAMQYSDQTDYNAMAAALKQLNLFKGSFTGYGQGFDLEQTPTRLQALIMFIRVLGEEEQALSWTGTTPFKDIAKGSQAEQYVGYAYSKGYTNGYSKTEFKPGLSVNAYQYTEFLLRAMGYSSAANTNLADTLTRGVAAGLLLETEAAALANTTFLRADLVYLSYYALQTPLAERGTTLGEALQSKGVFTGSQWNTANALVTDRRG